MFKSINGYMNYSKPVLSDETFLTRRYLLRAQRFPQWVESIAQAKIMIKSQTQSLMQLAEFIEEISEAGGKKT